MELFFNECSLHGQFGAIEEFETALENLMEMRQTAIRFNRELYCNRNGINSKVTQGLTIHQVINSIEKNKARAFMGWLSRTGPYWEDTRGHSEGEYFECQGEIVTDAAIGECAFCTFSNRQAQLVSITPSNWVNSPLNVSWDSSASQLPHGLQLLGFTQFLLQFPGFGQVQHAAQHANGFALFVSNDKPPVVNQSILSA